MKRKLFLSLLWLPMISLAQKFYSASEIEIGWKYWESESDLYYLCDYGNKVSLNCLPNLNWDGASLTNPAAIIATYLHENKFLVLSFSEYEGIRLRDSSYSNQSLGDINYIVEYLRNLSWFEINFEKIAYDVIFDQLLIPCGVDENGYANAICIQFVNSSSYKAPTIGNEGFVEENVKYYDLQGKMVDINTAKNQIVLKTDGKKTLKIYNR